MMNGITAAAAAPERKKTPTRGSAPRDVLRFGVPARGLASVPAGRFRGESNGWRDNQTAKSPNCSKQT